MFTKRWRWRVSLYVCDQSELQTLSAEAHFAAEQQLENGDGQRILIIIDIILNAPVITNKLVNSFPTPVRCNELREAEAPATGDMDSQRKSLIYFQWAAYLNSHLHFCKQRRT